MAWRAQAATGGNGANQSRALTMTELAGLAGRDAAIDAYCRAMEAGAMTGSGSEI